MLVHDGHALSTREVAALADRVWYPVWDAGLRLDHSVRTPAQCRDVGAHDLTAGVGLLDLRVIAGDADLVAATRARLLEDWRGAARRRLPEPAGRRRGAGPPLRRRGVPARTRPEGEPRRAA
ncbi:hypothetical protein GCM10025868_40550 [Angustibacter aerolatus]|uniref:Uncharacterized protein n=1 Tax=Angustibacter aerolatus TaxID=1162965 RepID=A0ABQ6JNH4_9ACTN|nr:hypothetical protein GCM10025868_40550 [Angustibacter aerolatus]